MAKCCRSPVLTAPLARQSRVGTKARRPNRDGTTTFSYRCVCCHWLSLHKIYIVGSLPLRQDKYGDTMGRVGQALHHSDSNNKVRTLLELTEDNSHILPAVHCHSNVSATRLRPRAHGLDRLDVGRLLDRMHAAAALLNPLGPHPLWSPPHGLRVANRRPTSLISAPS